MFPSLSGHFLPLLILDTKDGVEMFLRTARRYIPEDMSSEYLYISILSGVVSVNFYLVACKREIANMASMSVSANSPRDV
jgi:hypothetical protein